ncbi:MAG: hypothetical protein WB952_05805 [Terriglobales bacterium]
MTIADTLLLKATRHAHSTKAKALAIQQAKQLEKLAKVTAEMDYRISGIPTTPEQAMAESEPAIAPSDGSRIIWAGSQRDLALLMTGLRKKGKIKAKSEQELLRQICQHFSGENAPFDPDSLRTNLIQKRNKIAGEV